MSILKKLNFKQPKYVLPLVILPFFFFFSFVFNSWGEGKKELPKSTAGEHGMNELLPESSNEVQNGELKNKLDAFRQVYGKNTDLSALNGLSDANGIDNEFSSAYSTEDERLLAKIQKNDAQAVAVSKNANNDLAAITKMLSARGNPQAQANAIAMLSKNKGDEADEFTKRFGSLFNKEQKGGAPYGSYDNGGGEEDDYEKSAMRLFKQQMNYVDSANNQKMQEAGATGTNAAQMAAARKGLNSKNFEPSTARDILSVRYAKPSGGFNTVYSVKKQNSAGIPAIIDEDRKGMAGTRLRLKLMSDMYVGENILKKGTYLYAFVSGFGTQRVMLSVTQIMYKNQSLNVSLDLYDNDGYIGLYVPGSAFREFTKEVGDQSSRGLTSITTSEDQDQLTKSFLKSFFSGSANAASGLIKANKAQFKYNYVIYLKENKVAQ